MEKESYSVKVSIIIPVFNVQEYLDKALASIACQTIDSFEAIIINDGSTDDSVKIINDYVSRHENFHLIMQKNSGLSVARNEGLKRAKGEYVSFFDSDDFVQPDFLEKMYNACKKNNAELAYCAHYQYLHDRSFRFYMPFTARSGVLDKKKALTKLISDCTLHFFAWNKLYKRSLFTDNNIDFPSMYFEDIATTPRIFYYTNKVVVLSEALYNYTKRKGSILSDMNVKKINDFIIALGIIRNFLEKKHCYADYRSAHILVSVRTMICHQYSIIRTHILAHNFKGMLTNLKSSNKSLLYFISKDFQITDEDIQPPYPVILPKGK